jgi:MFS-type transporter involved in bile tolerance (Atg22 family)
LLQPFVSPYIKIILISVPQAIIPVLTLAEISSVVPPGHAGLAFGIIEALDSATIIAGNVLMGYLYNLTGSYTVGLTMVLGLCVLGFFNFVIVLYWKSLANRHHYEPIL